jgi:hypothetical protein
MLLSLVCFTLLRLQALVPSLLEDPQWNERAVRESHVINHVAMHDPAASDERLICRKTSRLVSPFPPQ